MAGGEKRRQSAKDWQRVIEDRNAPLYTVGVVADLVGVDPQVVRGYDKRGLVEPQRSESGHRRYSRRDIERLSRALELAEEGVSTAGIERVLELQDRLAAAEETEPEQGQ
ncbi:MAG: MerR family transcriptional regulator [Nitriliruptorales bacterium]